MTAKSPSSSGSSSAAAGREWVCSQAEGEVLEPAAGTARNFLYYPRGVKITAVELSPAMLAIAHKRAEELGRDEDLRLGEMQALGFPDQSFDTVVCTLGLCTIPDPRKAISEAHRVLRPDGKLLLLEHVRSPSRPVRAVERMLERLSVRFQADHLTTDPLDYLEAEGFEVERLERSKWGIVERLAARRRDAPGSARSEGWGSQRVSGEFLQVVGIGSLPADYLPEHREAGVLGGGKKHPAPR